MSQPAITKIEDLSFSADFVVTKAFAQVDGSEKGDWIIEGFAATTDVDLQDEQIEQSAVEGAAKDLLKNSTVLFNHDEERPIAKVIAAEPQDRSASVPASGLEQGSPAGIFVRMKLSKTEPEIWQKVQEGIINKLSIRGRVLDAVKRWSEALKKYVKVIKKMTLVEVSLVSVPANPEAKTLRWYVAKSLNDFTKSGGRLPSEGNGPPEDEGATMSGSATTTTPAAPAQTMLELAYGLTDIEKSWLGRVHTLVDGLLVSEKDETRKGALAVLKSLADELTLGKAQIVSKGLPPTILAGLATTMKKSKIDQVASILDTLSADEVVVEAKKNLGELVASIRPAAPAPAALDPMATLAKLEEGSSDDKVKLAVRTAFDFLKSNKSMAAISSTPAPAAPTPTPAVATAPSTDLAKALETADRLEKLLGTLNAATPTLTALTAAISKAEAISKGKLGAAPAAGQTEADATETGGDSCAPSADGMCPPGYTLQDGMCYRSGAKKAAGAAAPVPAPAVPAPAPVAPAPTPAPAPEDVLAKALAKAMLPISKRLGEIERRAGIRKSLDGQEGIDTPEASSSDSKPLSKALLDPARGALHRSGAMGATKKPTA